MKTAALLLVAVTVSTSLFLQSSAVPDPLLGLGTLLKDIGNTGLVTDVVSVVEGTVDALVGKGVKTCTAYVLLLTKLGVVLQAAQERLYGFLTDVTKELDKDIANASGALKELLTKLNATLKVLLKALPELLKALVATVANPTEENLNKVEADLQLLKQILAKLKEALDEDTAGILPFFAKSTMVAISNSAQDGYSAFEVVVETLKSTDQPSQKQLII